jgi:hypothetical protein
MKIFQKVKEFLFIPQQENPQNKELIENLFSQVRNSKANNQFEALPKFLLSKIFCYLDYKNLCTIFRLNKFFLKVMSEPSIPSNNIYKSFLEGVMIDEQELQSHLNEIERTEFDKQMNHYYQYLKVKFISNPKNNQKLKQFVENKENIHSFKCSKEKRFLKIISLQS